MDNVKEKIEKLLRLSKSDNEHEAKLAILRAKELMAKHKLGIEDFDVEDSNKEVIEWDTDYYYTDYKDGYRWCLAKTLAKNYCCVCYIKSEYGSKCKFITFKGYEEDIKILLDVFKFADDCIRKWFFDKKHSTFKGMNNIALNAIKNDYGIGFADGLSKLLDEQMSQKQQEWGLVMVTPKEAIDYIMTLDRTCSDINMFDNDNIKNMGYSDGYSSELHDKLVI